MSVALVTGARGFGGSWLARSLLSDGVRVVSLNRANDRLSGLSLLGIAEDVVDVEGDVRDSELVAKTIAENEVDTVYHLAAQAIVGEANASPVPTFESNIEGTWTVLEACRVAEVERVVVASSDKAYGPHDQLPYAEGASLQPIYPYDVSKAATDLIARSYWHTYGLPVAVTRFANLYGGGDQNFSRLVPGAVSAALAGRRPVIRSDGTPERDFLHVDDVVRAYRAIADALRSGDARGEALNAGWGRPNSVRDVVELICELAGGDVEPDFQGTGNPDGEIDRQYLASGRLTELTGWKPEIGLREGLAKTIEWYREHPHARGPG